MPPTGKYLPLLRYLEGLSPDQQQVALTFAELEQLLGAPLPATAWLGFFWARSGVSRRNWERSGFTARLAYRQPCVTFTRAAAPAPSRLLDTAAGSA